MKSDEYKELKKEISQLRGDVRRVAILLGRVTARVTNDPSLDKVIDEVEKHN
jgi:hypothetical protein